MLRTLIYVIDIDECKGANTCNTTTSVCYDEYGSHRCVCKVGYKEQAVIINNVQKTTCVRKYFNHDADIVNEIFINNITKGMDDDDFDKTIN